MWRIFKTQFDRVKRRGILTWNIKDKVDTIKRENRSWKNDTARYYFLYIYFIFYSFLFFPSDDIFFFILAVIDYSQCLM